MTCNHRRLGARRIVIAFLILIAGLAGSAPAVAVQSEVGITIHDQSVVSEFPSGLMMTLSATTDEAIDQASVRFQVGTVATSFETTTRFAATSDIDVELQLPLQLFGIPPGVDIEYQWRLETESGGTVITESQTVSWLDDRYEWGEYRMGDIIVFAYGNDASLYEYTAQIAQQYVDQYQEFLEAPGRPEPIRIWLYESGEELAGALTPNSRDWIGGVSYATFSIIAGVVPEGGENSMLRLVPHEVIHQILADATRNPFAIPAAWFDEGLAGWGQPVGTENFDQMVQIALEEDRLPTVRSMMSEWGSDGTTARTAYAASYSLVSFIVDTMGDDSILRLTESYRAGLSHDDVLTTALGMTAEELDAAWRESLQA